MRAMKGLSRLVRRVWRRELVHVLDRHRQPRRSPKPIGLFLVVASSASAIAAACASAPTPGPVAAGHGVRIVRTEAAAEIDGAIVTVRASQVGACPDTGALGCNRIPAAGREVSLVERDSHDELAAANTDLDGIARFDLVDMDASLPREHTEVDVVIDRSVRATIDLSPALESAALARAMRAAGPHVREARDATTRGDWRACQDAANACIRLVPNHPECTQVLATAVEKIREQDAVRRQAIADEQTARATTAQRSRQWQDAYDAATRCLDADATRAACQDLKTNAASKLVVEIAKRARAALDGNRVVEALREARRCLQMVGDHRDCQVVATAVETYARSAQRVREFAVYREGDGYIVYFNVVSRDGDVLDLPGRAELVVVARDPGGFDLTGWPATAWAVTAESYRRVAIGLGGLQRASVITSQWFQRNIFFQHAIFQGLALDLFLRDHEMVVRLNFTDAFGRSFGAEAPFLP